MCFTPPICILLQINTLRNIYLFPQKTMLLTTLENYIYFAKYSNLLKHYAMRNFLLLLAVAISSLANSLYAQAVSGRVVDSDKAGIDGAAVVMTTIDSIHVAAMITDADGAFSFAQRPDRYRLIIQHISYKTRFLESDKSDLGEIALNSADHTLGEVVVKAEKPFVKANRYGMEYNLEEVAKNKIANNAWEALAKLPAVHEEGGNLVLAGAAGLTVVLNSKPTTMSPEQLSMLLKSMPTDRVERVEVMYSAPPQLHVRGAVLNVVLKRSNDYSFQGIVNAGYRNQFYSAGGANANVRLSTPKFAVDLTYGASAGKKQQHTSLLSHHSLNGTIYDIVQNERMTGEGLAHNVRAAAEYNISDKSNISAAYTGSYSPDMDSRSLSDGTFQKSVNEKTSDTHMHNIMLQGHFGFGLDFGADYTRYESDLTQNLDIAYANASTAKIKTASSQEIDRYSIYADRSRNLPEGWTLGYGASYTYARDRDRQTYLENAGDRPVQDSDSDLKEQTTDFYLSIGKQYAAGPSFSLSVTGEYYTIGGYNRWSVFPQANATYFKNPNHIFQLSLTTDKTYPEYWNMVSSIAYIDGYSEIHGSPGLKPVTNYSANLAYIWKQKYVAALFYNYKDNNFMQVAYQSPDRLALIYKSMNWNYSSNLGFNIMVPFSAGKWLSSRFSIVGMLSQQRCDDFYDVPFDRSKFVVIPMLDNTFNVNRHISFELNGRIQTPAIQGTWDIKTVYNLDAGMKWKFAKENATLSIMCNDILDKGFPNSTVDFKGQRLEMTNNRYHRSLSINFSYKFGGYKARNSKKVDTSRFGH